MVRINPRRLLCVVVAVAWSLSGPASAQQLYKNVMPDGRVIYTDEPLPGAVQSRALETPAPLTPEQRDSALKRLEDDKRRRSELQGRIDERRKTFNAADERVVKARRGIEQAQAALERGRAAQAGDITGTAGGGARPNEEYFRRIGELERSVETARKDLDDALKARNDAR